VRKSIPPGIDLPSSQLPRRLDKPMHTVTSQTYAKILKKQFSLTSNTAATTDNNRPPRKRQATKFDYDSDTSNASLSTTTTATTTTINSNATPATTTQNTTTNDHISELLSLKTEIAQLKSTILTAVQQIVQAVESLHATQQQKQSNAMDTDRETSTSGDADLTEPTNHNQHTLDLAALVQDLKYDIATIVMEMRALFKEQVLLAKNNQSPSSSVT